ncbi:MAG: PAS domain S-box protein [Alphaproteobacteria bacterium]|nr:PAS domain S-box protein [Alphaproteobacteria bacterium]
MKAQPADFQNSHLRRRKGDRRRDESERRLRNVVDAAPVPLFISRAEDGRILYVNEPGGQLFATPVEKLIGRKVTDFYVDPARRNHLVAALEKQGVVKDFPLDLRSATGEVFSAQLSTHPIVYNDDLALFSTATNLTERARAERALRESEERFRSAFEAAPHGFALVDPEGKFIKVNRALCEFTGYDEAELLAKNFEAITHPDDLEKDLAHFRQTLAGDISTYQMEKRYLHKAGHAVWGLLSVSLVRDAEGSPLYFVSQIYDLTQRKKTEAALEESNRRLRGILDYSPLMISIKDVDGHYKLFSRRYEELLGQTNAALIGKTIEERYPDQPDVVAQTKREDRALLKTGRPLEKYMTTRGFPDKERTALVTKFLLRGPDGEPNEICGIAIDISERRAAEEALEESQRRLQSILDYSPIYITIKGTDGRYRVFNRQYELGSGIKSEDVVGKTAVDRFHESPEVLAEIEREDKELLQSGKPMQNFESVRVLKGEERTLLATKFPLMGTDGKPDEIISIAMDITERKRAEEAFKESHRQLQGILDYAPIGIALKDTDGRYKWVNRYYARLTGIPLPDAIVGKTAGDAFSASPIDTAFLEESRSSDKELLRTGKPLYQESFKCPHDGQTRTLQRTKFLILDENGKPSELCSIVHDITDRQKIEEALRANEEQFRLILESVGEGIYGLDLEGQGTFVNPAVAEMTGFAIEELIGQKLHPLIHHSYPDGRPYPAEACPMYRAFMDGTVHHRKDEVLWRKNGTSFPIEYTSTPLRKDGEVVGAVVTFSDVTERREAEKALQTSHLQLQGILNYAPFCVSLKDLEGRYKWVNRYYEDMLGLRSEDLVGKTAVEAYAKGPLTQDAAKRTHERDMEVARSSEPSYEQGIVQRMKDGKLHYFRRTKFALRDGDGNPTEICSIAMDITESAEMEQALRESEARFRNIAERAPVPISINRISDGTFLYANPAVAALHDVPGGKLTAAWKSPDFYQDPSDRVTIMKRLIREGHLHDVGVNLKKVDGTPISAVVSIARITFDNEDAVMNIVHDVTQIKAAEKALRESEARFRAVVEGSPLPLIIARTSDGCITYANTHVGTAFDTNPESLIGRPTMEFYQNPKERETIKELVEQTGNLTGYELEMKKADGTPISVLLSVHKVVYEGEEALLSGFHDITAFKQAEEQLRQATKMEAIGQLTGGIAHDFNNLLGVVIGNLELLDETARDEAIRNFVRRALGAADRGAALTQRLLAFSRKQALQPLPTNLNKLVSGMTELFEHSLSKVIEIKTRLTDDLWPAMVDPNQLESVILNLALNAQDAMPGGGTLTLTTENADIDAADAPDDKPASGRYVLLTVRDTGIGIPKHDQARVFDPFFTTKGVGKGSGLGLSVVYGFIRQSGGQIRIESALGEGTAIRVYLPAAAEGVEAAETTLPELQELEGNGETILVVEDDMEMRSMAKRMLTGLNYRVIEAEDAFAALKLLDSTPNIDLLFTDVVLPRGLNGVELAKKARARREGLKVLLTSGYVGEFPEPLDWGDLGTDLVEKPYRKRVLAMKIRETLAAA